MIYAFPARFMVRMMYALLGRLLAHWQAKLKTGTPLALWHVGMFIGT